MQYIKKNPTTSSILLFILIISIIQYNQPAFLCNQDGSYKVFGLGYRNKTIVPMWLVVLLVAILSYVSILYINMQAY